MTPAYQRLQAEDRRRQLLERGAELFARYSYDEISMGEIAREVGISKPLLYHYFPSKRKLFEAALAQAAEQHFARIAGATDVATGLDAFLAWIEANPQAYVKLMRSAGIPEVRELIDRVREETADRIVEGLGDDRPAVRAAVRGWLWSMDGVCLDWVTEGDLDRDQVRALLLGTLQAALQPAGAVG